MNTTYADVGLTLLANRIREWPKAWLQGRIYEVVPKSITDIRVLMPSVGTQHEFFIDAEFSFNGRSVRALLERNDATEKGCVDVSVVVNNTDIIEGQLMEFGVKSGWWLLKPAHWPSQAAVDALTQLSDQFESDSDIVETLVDYVYEV